MPGQPSGKVENRRCRRVPNLMVGSPRRRATPSKGVFRILLSKEIARLQIDDSALQGYSDGVGPVIGPKFGEDVFDVALHSYLGQR